MNADDERLTALKEQVKQRRHAMLDAARAGGGVVDAQQWEELERLQRLVDLEAASGSARAARRRTRTAQLLLAGVVALVVLTLLLLRLPTARVGLQVQATEARMILEQQTALLPRIPGAVAHDRGSLRGHDPRQTAPRRRSASPFSASKASLRK